MHRSAKFQTPPNALDLLWSCEGLWRVFLLCFLGQIVTWQFNPNILDQNWPCTVITDNEWQLRNGPLQLLCRSDVLSFGWTSNCPNTNISTSLHCFSIFIPWLHWKLAFFINMKWIIFETHNSVTYSYMNTIFLSDRTYTIKFIDKS